MKSGSHSALASQHAPVLHQVVELLGSHTGHSQLVKVKSHMGMPCNAAADAQPDTGMFCGNPVTSTDMAVMPLSFCSLVPAPLSKGVQSKCKHTEKQEKQSQKVRPSRNWLSLLRLVPGQQSRER